MAWCRDAKKVVEVANADTFKKIYDPGDKVPVSGIYDCKGCKREITSNSGDPFPPQNHHQHPVGAGAIRWQLLVQTNTTGI